MKSFSSYLLGTSLVLLCSGCAMHQVHTDYDSSHSFADYKTFAWLVDRPIVVEGSRMPSPISAKHITSEIERTLETKGFRQVAEPSDADFVVQFTVGTRDGLQIDETQVMAFYGSGWGWGYDYFGVVQPMGFPTTQVTYNEYTEGSLAIDVFDVAKKSPVWHGTASKRLSEHQLVGIDTEQSTREAVALILADFPPVE